MEVNSLRRKSEQLTKGGSMPRTFSSSESRSGIPTIDGDLRDFGNDDEANTVEPAGAPTWKRALDLTLILVSLPIWLPIMVLLMLFIKVASPGPAFYRQERIGARRKRFLLYKFRSMKVNSDTSSHEDYFERLMRTDAPMAKLDAADDRIIPGGRFLRATGLDELPQLFNVIRGEMSLVGPRPCTVPEFARYQPWQRERANALPGLTGYWQVNGKNRTTFNQMIEMDIFYARHSSLGLDLSILSKTLPAVWRQATGADATPLQPTGSVRRRPSNPPTVSLAQAAGWHR